MLATEPTNLLIDPVLAPYQGSPVKKKSIRDMLLLAQVVEQYRLSNPGSNTSLT
jgi:hypothetical protein